MEKERRSLSEALESITQLNKVVEDGVRKALARMKVPRREELAEVRSRLDRLAERIRELEK